MAGERFTIGHSNHITRRFLALLSGYEIQLVCDVRSSPYSRFNPQVNRGPLTAAPAAQNVAYPFLGNMLGGKPRGTDYLPEDGARFSLIAETEQFRTGLDRLQEEVWCRRTAIM
jgi:uncharacterized protein (DUF488 family)